MDEALPPKQKQEVVWNILAVTEAALKVARSILVITEAAPWQARVRGPASAPPACCLELPAVISQDLRGTPSGGLEVV